MKLARFLMFMLVTAALPATLWAQTAATAKISGLVTDASGAVVRGAVVKLVDKATKAEKTAATNDEGRYAFANIDPAIYDLTVTAQGFRTVLVSDIKADVTVATIQDLTLQLGGVDERVTVTATEEAQLKTEDSSVGNVLNVEQLKRLPNINRNATALLPLQPAVTPGGEVSGARADQNVFNLDGLDVSDNVGFRGATGTVVPIPVESVQEFRVGVANSNATFGRAGGGQGALITKRGGNAFHGSAYENHRNSALNANSWSNNRLGLKKPGLIDNLFGGTIGGPVWHDRTFFFFHYEGDRQVSATQITRIVPTQNFRNGVLTFRDATGGVFTLDPKTSTLCGPGSNQLCDPRALGSNPQILQYLRLYPQPNNLTFGDGLNTGGFTANLPANLRSDYEALRLDHQINKNWSLDVKGALYRQINPGGAQANLIDRKFGDNVSQRPKNLLVALNGTLTPRLVNDFRVGHVFDNFILSVISPTQRSGFNLPINLAPNPNADAGVGALLDELVDVDTQRARQQSISTGTTEFSDDLTYFKGTHSFQFGGNFRRITTSHFRDDKVIGSLTTPVAGIGSAGSVIIPATQRPPTCGGGVTTNCLRSADLTRYNQLYASLLGIVDNVSYLAVRDGDLQPLPIGAGLVNDTSQYFYQFYFADTWRMKPSLTFTYGLQYQWASPPVEEQGRQTVLVFKDNLKLVDPIDYLRQKRAAAENGDIFNPDIGYLPLKDAGRDGTFDIYRKDISPRASLAWQPSFKNGLMGRLLGERKTVVRGGYGLVYDRFNTISSVVLPIISVGFAQTLSRAAPLNSAGQPFRVGVDGPIPGPLANFAATPPVTPAKAVGPSVSHGELISLTVDPKTRDPYNHTVDFTIQRELPGRMLLEVGYIGRFARNLYQNVNLNSAPIFFKDKASGQRFAEAFDAVAAQLRAGVAPGAVTQQPWFENQVQGFPGGGTRFLAGIVSPFFVSGDVSTLWNIIIDGFVARPFNNRQVPDLFVRTNTGRSNYNAMFVTLHKRLSGGLLFDFNYTLSKSLDQVGLIQNNVGLFSTSFDPDVDYSPSFFDTRHVLNSNFVYDLPFGAGRRFSAGKVLNHAIGGWYVSGLFTAASGAPLTVSQGAAAFGGAILFGLPVGAIPTKEPDFGNSLRSGVAGSGGVGVSGNPAGAQKGSGLSLFANPEQVFKSFRPVLLSQDGRQGRGVLRGFPRWNLNLGIGKETKIKEQMKVTFRVDFFNIFNHTQFSNPDLNLQSPATFGVITGAFGQRALQSALRFEF